MKKSIIAIFLSIFLFVSLVYSQNFDKTIDFAIDLEALDRLASGKNNFTINTGKYIILTGVISKIHIISKNENAFIAEIELTDGKWKGVESVIGYHCIIRLEGKEFFKRIYNAREKERFSEIKDIIKLNSYIMVVGKIKGFRKINGVNTGVIAGTSVRTVLD